MTSVPRCTPQLPTGPVFWTMTPANVGYGAPSWTPDGLHIMYRGTCDLPSHGSRWLNPNAINRMDLSFVGYGYYAVLQPTP